MIFYFDQFHLPSYDFFTCSKIKSFFKPFLILVISRTFFFRFHSYMLNLFFCTLYDNFANCMICYYLSELSCNYIFLYRYIHVYCIASESIMFWVVGYLSVNKPLSLCKKVWKIFIHIQNLNCTQRGNRKVSLKGFWEKKVKSFPKKVYFCPQI